MNALRAPGRADVVESWDEVGPGDPQPLIVMEPLEAALDSVGMDRGQLRAFPIGDGHSNVTYLLRRGEDQCVLRRPPRGPLPPSAHDVLREAHLIASLYSVGMRVPEVLASFADEKLIGGPFFLMAYLPGVVLTSDMPPTLAGPSAAEEVATSMIEGMVELHAVEVEAAGLESFRRKSGYLGRQIERFRTLLEVNATRPLPQLEQVGHWLQVNMPESGREAVVHGDYRLGNLMFSTERVALLAILDWEMGTLGDPLADLGYCTVMWSHRGDLPNPIANLTPITRIPGFPRRESLAERYSAMTGTSLESLSWYQALAAWKSAIFLEGSYKRYLAGTDSDPYFAGLKQGVLQLADIAINETRH